MLDPGVPVSARVSQISDDVFSIEATAGQTILFRVESLNFEVCPLFAVIGPGETVLYQEPDTLCRDFERIEPLIQVEGAFLTIIPDEAFELQVPAETDGVYFIIISEGAQADNLFTFSWEYRLTAIVE
jgi:hypothetical protein